MLDFLLNAPVATVIFLVTIVTSLICFQNRDLLRKLMLNPYSVVHEKHYETILTSGFIHGDWMHLLFNMMTFYFFGFQLEEYMVIMGGNAGHILFGAMYILAIVLSDVSTIVKHKNNPGYYSLGASGAISAVLFSYILFDPSSKIGILFFPLPVPAPIFAVLYLAYSVYASRNNHDHINHEAHYWGAAFGILFTAVAFPGILPYFFEQLKQMF